MQLEPVSIEVITNAIKSSHLNRRPVLIAIEGYGGSGKSTLANKQRIALQDSFVINIDDFIIKAKIDEMTCDKSAFDRKRLEQQVLIPAANNQIISYQMLDWASNILTQPVDVPNVNYLIIEGISSFHPDIARYYDYKIWVDTPIEIAKARGKTRDAGNENESKWDLWAANDLGYQKKYQPGKKADFIITNDDNSL